MSIFDTVKNPTRLIQAFDVYTKTILASWIEVWSASSAQWIAVDPIRNIVTRSCSEMLPSLDSVTHVVAAERVGVFDRSEVNLTDVTKTYVGSKWSKCRKRRLWIESTYVQLLNGLSTGTSSHASTKMMTSNTETKTFPSTNDITMPSTMYAFRVRSVLSPVSSTNVSLFQTHKQTHPTLCLEVHLDRNHIIRDKDKEKARVGLFKGRDIALAILCETAVFR